MLFGMNKEFIKKSIYAGILIGIGDLVYILLENKMLAAMLFSLGLLTIIHQQLFLYTGKIGFCSFSIFRYFMMLLLNLSGILLTVYIGINARPEIAKTMFEISNNKFSHTLLEMLLLGVLCGMCMYIAVSCKNQIITIFSIMVFILCGFEHCIADIPYLCINFNINNLIKYLMIIIGNSFGAIILNMLNKSEEIHNEQYF